MTSPTQEIGCMYLHSFELIAIVIKVLKNIVVVDRFDVIITKYC